MGLCSDAPDYPKKVMQAQIDSSEALGNRYLDQSQQQQDYWQNQWDTYMLPMMKDTFGVQTDVMRAQYENAQKDRTRYEDKYLPIEDNLISEFESYDSPQRQAAEAARAKAAVQQSWDAQRQQAEQRLASYGIDPSQLKSGALDLSARVQVAAAQAAAGTEARRRVEDTGRSLRAEAINIGRGMPSNVAAAYGQTLNAGNSAIGNMNSTYGQGANMLGTGQGWGQMGSNQINSTMSGINNMYSGQLAGYNAGGGAMGALGNIAGQAFGAWAGSGFAEGGGAVGALPNDNYSAQGGGAVGALQGSDLSATPGPNDNIPLTVAQDEYILPKDVVLRLGTEKLDKLVESTRQKAAEKGGANARTPAGEMPNPEPPVHGQTMAAEGGGAVGYIPPVAIQAQPQPIAMTAPPNDPFLEHRMATGQAPMQMADMDMAIQSGAAARENWDDGKGLPGVLKDWVERRKTMGAAEKVLSQMPETLGE